MKIDPNEPANSIVATDGSYYLGITKREYFAALAMQGYCSNNALNIHEFETVAELFVNQADALIEALNKEQ